MRIDPLPKLTPVAIRPQPNGYAATLVNVRHHDTGEEITSQVYPTITEAIEGAEELAAAYGYALVN